MSEIKFVVDDSRIEAKVDALQADVDRLLYALVKPRVIFTFGPITEQEQHAHGRQQASSD
jgi:hypothetical protein